MIHKFEGDYRFLSNFHCVQVQYGNFAYPSVECAYQAQKCEVEADKEKFTNITSSEAKKLGKSVRIRQDWERLKVAVMEDLVFQKFSGSEDLRSRLLKTAPHYIVEGNTWGDTFWGVCNGKGQNRLGKILMDVRRTFIKPKVVHCKVQPYDVYIGRPSKWGNPIPMYKETERTPRIQAFRRIETANRNIDEYKELWGKTLGCWCSPRRCHGDVLALRALKLYDKEVEADYRSATK